MSCAIADEDKLFDHIRSKAGAARHTAFDRWQPLGLTVEAPPNTAAVIVGLEVSKSEASVAGTVEALLDSVYVGPPTTPGTPLAARVLMLAADP